MRIVQDRHARSVFPFALRRREHRSYRSTPGDRHERRRNGTASRALRGHREGRGDAPALLLRAIRLGGGRRQRAELRERGPGGQHERRRCRDRRRVAALSDYAGHVTFYVEVPDVEASLVTAESLGGNRVFGPDKVPGTDIEIGQFTDPEGHLIGVMRTAS